jgi:biopolymer transport protein ExbB/TolQ
VNTTPPTAAPAAPRGAQPVSLMTYSLVTLLLSAILVQTVFALVIRPRADAILAERTAAVQQGRQTSLRSIWVILRDYEQETSIILALWALTLLGWHARHVIENRRLLALNLLDQREEFVILPEDVRSWSRQVAALVPHSGEQLLPRAINLALARFAVTRSVHEAASAAREECETEAASLDADLSMLRFVVWAIPAVGFVGTVRGIGNALQDAQRALGGDISGVTLGLGITFNATLTALTLCILIMFLLHQLQQAQDRLVLDTRAFIERRLIARMRVT